ncbi:MAG: carboxyl transferase domain-containing protein [Burkholderiaceae bacterium]|nr:carboxyl transferase domain-containing protein [Burkholderiaceae bacterium]
MLHLCDSAGAFLEELSGVYIEGGRVLRNQCLLSRVNVPQIAMVFGHCTAGGAYIPALCDYSIIARIIDGSRFHEYQPAYGTTLVCGYAYLWGYRIGILANNGVLFSDSSKKAAHFIALCNQNRTPLVFLQNTTGYMIGRNYEMEGITKDGAKMLMAQAGSEVPKFTVITSAAFGAGYYGMCGRAWDPRFIWAWPNIHMGVMGPEQAANTLADVKIAQLRRHGHEPDVAEMKILRDRVYEKAERESSAYFATSRLWDDGLLAPTDTRNALGMALSAASHAPIAEPHYGIFRF